jgi:hypothetical protein
MAKDVLVNAGAGEVRVAVVEEPIATSSIVPMYFVCQRARQDRGEIQNK